MTFSNWWNPTAPSRLFSAACFSSELCIVKVEVTSKKVLKSHYSVSSITIVRNTVSLLHLLFRPWNTFTHLVTFLSLFNTAHTHTHTHPHPQPRPPIALFSIDETSEAGNRGQAAAAAASQPVQCYSCGSLFSRQNSACDNFDRNNASQKTTCNEGEGCLLYTWQKSQNETGKDSY